MHTYRSHMGKLTRDMQCALLICKRDGRLVEAGKIWFGEKSRLEVKAKTIYSLFDRYLLTVTFGGNTRRLHHARLSETGEFVANSLTDLSVIAPAVSLAPHGISEESARFIAQVTA